MKFQRSEKTLDIMPIYRHKLYLFLTLISCTSGFRTSQNFTGLWIDFAFKNCIDSGKLPCECIEHNSPTILAFNIAKDSNEFYIVKNLFINNDNDVFKIKSESDTLKFKNNLNNNDFLTFMSTQQDTLIHTTNNFKRKYVLSEFDSKANKLELIGKINAEYFLKQSKIKCNELAIKLATNKDLVLDCRLDLEFINLLNLADSGKWILERSKDSLTIYQSILPNVKSYPVIIEKQKLKCLPWKVEE